MGYGNIFAITAATNSVQLDPTRHGEVAFTVSNDEIRPIRGRAYIVAEGAANESWFTLNGPREQDFAVAGTQQFTVTIHVPQSVPAGSYYFRLNMVGVANPDEEFTEGPTVSFTVPQPLQKERPFPWWILLVLVGALLIAGLAFFLFSRAGQRQDIVEPPNGGENAFNTVGDSVLAGDVVITLNSAGQGGTSLIANFTFENKGQTDFPIRPRADFTAIGENRETILQDFFVCPNPGLPTVLAPGDLATGNICFRTTGSAPVDIIFRTNAVDEGAIVWRIE